jgi:uncharacterized protein (TIGR00369 family)
MTECSVISQVKKISTVQSISDSGFSGFLDVRMLKVEKGQIIGEVCATERHATASGTRVHGGLLMAFADVLGAAGTVLNLPDDHWTSTVESKTNFLAAAKFGWLRGEASPVHIGRTTQVWSTRISDCDGRLVAMVTQTQLVLPALPSSLKAKAEKTPAADLRRPAPVPSRL